MTPHQQMAYDGIQRIVGLLHQQEPSMKEADIARLVSEAVYGYFDIAWELREIADFPAPEE